MTHIVQIVPVMGPGSGVAGVAWNLEREFTARGLRSESFTWVTARRGKPARSWPHWRLGQAMAQTWQMLWFFIVGTARAREFLAERPCAVSVCHNNVMAGDIYVNHGLVIAAMRARGGAWWRMVRNPTHLFTYFRDRIRYRTGIHRAVVVLSEAEHQALVKTYGRISPRIEVIPNGVDLERFHLPTPDERSYARACFGLDREDRVVLFVGHEFGRKGLAYAIDALEEASSVLLMVVGGRPTTVNRARKRAQRVGVAHRVLFTGPRSDMTLIMHAADMLGLPSAYEANALVILEALASGLPVISTRTGYAPEIIVDGANGYLVERDAHDLAVRFEQIADSMPGSWTDACRKSVEHLSWELIAARYVALAEMVRADRSGRVGP